MEITPQNFSLKQLLNRLNHHGAKPVSPDLLWQIILGCGALGVIFIAVFAYTTYSWAKNVDQAPSSNKGQREVLSVAELESVIAIYQNKETESAALLKSPPVAPEYKKGKGVLLQPSDIMGSTTDAAGSSTER